MTIIAPLFVVGMMAVTQVTPPTYVPSAPLAPAYAPPAPLAQDPAIIESSPLTEEPVAPPPPPVITDFFSKRGVFTVINKRTAKSEQVTVTAGIATMSERVEITLHQCHISKAKIVPEHAALVEIFAPKGTELRTPLYTGWLLANHPHATMIVHPDYDITLTRCIEEEAEPAAATDKEQTAPADAPPQE
jgi:hypothetical protein